MVTCIDYKLRPYQKTTTDKCVEFFLSHKKHNGLVVLPCGSGKSLIIANIAKQINDNVLILQPTKEILEQNYEKYLSYGEKASIYSASFNSKEISKVTFATIGSIIRHKEHFTSFKYIIIDEADKVNAKGGMYKEFLDYVNGQVIGTSGTPFRLNTDGFGGSMLKFLTRTRPRIFKEVIHYVQIKDLIEQGYLCKMEYINDDIFNSKDIKLNTTGADFREDSLLKYNEKIRQNQRVIDSIEQYKDRQGIICFVTSVRDAELISQQVDKSVVVHAKTNKKEREQILNDFKEGKIKVIINCQILTYGFDYPELDTIIVARPTMSLTLHIQFLGRGMRPHEKKDHCLIIDLTDNHKKFGKIEDLVYHENEGKPFISSRNKQLTNVYFGKETVIRQHKLNISDKVMPFGKYKGKLLHSIPRHYLEWLLKDCNLYGTLYPG